MKAIILFTLTLLKLTDTSGQSKDIISTNIEIVGKGNFYDRAGCKDYCYLARFEVHNNEDTTILLTVYNCSWYFNWKSNNDSIQIAGWGCNANSPELIKLQAGKSLIFYASIYTKPDIKNKSFQMAFGNAYANLEDYYKNKLVNGRPPNGKLYWSNVVTLQDSYPYFSYWFTK